MKKLISSVISLLCACALCACSVTISTGSSSDPTPTPTVVYVTPAPAEPAPAAVPDSESEPEPVPTEEPAPAIAVGDIITMGRFEQDTVQTNGGEDIEWLVLDVKDGKAFLISRYILDHQTFSANQWSKSQIRTWLNRDFYDDAFSDSEKQRILTTTVTADLNPDKYLTDPGKDTEDRVFLLSAAEAKVYFPQQDYGCEPTPYALRRGVYCKFDINGNWWLRTPGDSDGKIAYVTHDSLLSNTGSYSTYTGIGVRPAMWIALD